MSGVSHASESYSHDRAKKIVWGVSVGVFLSALDQTIVAPILPSIRESLSGAGELSWVISAYLLTVTIGTPFAGKLSDVYGRRPVLISAILVFAAASVLCALSQTMWQLILARALQGVGGAGLMTMAHAAIADVVPPRQRGRYQIYLSSMWALGSVGGPVLGGLLSSEISWRLIFWLNVPLALLALAICDRGLRDLVLPSLKKSAIDYQGAVVITLLVANGILILSWAGTVYPWTSASILALICLETLLLAILITVESRSQNPFMPLSLFQNRTTATAFLMSFCNAFITFGAMLVFPLKFGSLWGQEGASAGVLLVPLLLGIATFTFVGGTLARKIGRLKSILVSSFGAIIAGALATIALDAPGLELLSLVPMTLIGCGIGLAQPAITLAVQSSVSRSDMGVASSTMLLMRSVGGAFGASLCGAAVFANSHGGTVQHSQASMELALLFCSAMSIVGFLTALTSHEIHLERQLRIEK